MQDEDRKTVLERLASAMVSGNLEEKPDGLTDLDYLVALGWAVRRVGGPASALLRLTLAEDPEAFNEAVAATIRVARKLNVKRGWDMLDQDIRRVARTALKIRINPICPDCLGTKFLRVPGTPMLSNRVCPRCHGSGKKPLPLRNRKQIATILTVLETIDQVTQTEMIRELYGKAKPPGGHSSRRQS